MTTQGEILSDSLSAGGYAVVSVSASPNRYVRLLDIAATLVRERRRIDLLIIQVYGGASFVVEDLASRLGRMFGKRIVMHLHGGAFPTFVARFPRWSRQVLRRADAIVTPSPFLARAMLAHGFAAQVIPNMIDLGVYPCRLRTAVRPRLFWMRSLHPLYNPAMALRVLARLRAEMPEATLTLAGQDKGLAEPMRRLAADLGLTDAVRFPGFLDAEGKAREGAAADIFINTNHVDNAPVAVVEACAMGLPVVATAVGGVPDLVVDGETALLVPDNDDVAMAHAIQRLVAYPELAARLSANGPPLAEQLSRSRVVPQWETLLAEVGARSACVQENT